jgi:uncharacterized protein (DUF1501 family)
MSKPCFHCKEFTRSRLFHGAAAEAGNGLPSTEPGMPIPAGTGLDRRTFITRSAGLALVVYGGASMRPEAFDEGILEAAAQAPDGRVLVSVFLEGGADPLSILAPATDSIYRKLRSRLALAPTLGLPLLANPLLRWHPAAQGLATLDKEGKLGVLPGIGYPSSDGSHFTSRHYWEVGSIAEGLGTGWLGRYLDRNGSPKNPIQGLSLSAALQPALAPERAPVAAISLPQLYRLQLYRQVQERGLDTLQAMGKAHRRSRGALREAAQTGAFATALHRRIQPGDGSSLQAPIPPVPYPSSSDEFPARLAALAAFIGAGLPIRCAAVNATGNFDTHAGQKSLDPDLKTTCDSLLAFQRDIEKRGLADRILVHVWSEFGRRPQDNASLGTDHGAAGIGFVIGTNARSGLLSEYPSLTKLDANGNLVPTIDFRGVYSAVLEQWLGADPSDVVPDARKFARPSLLR